MEPVSPQNNQQYTTHIHMPHISRELLYIIGAFLIGALLTYLILSQQSQKDTQKQTVTIIGSGTVEIPADQVSIYGRINLAANTEKVASDELQKTMDTLKKKILAMGVSEAELNISYPYVTAPYDKPKVLTPSLPPVPDDRVYFEDYSTTKSSTVLGISTPTNAYFNSYVGSSSIDILLGKDKFDLIDKLVKLMNDTPNAASEGKPYYQIKTITPYVNEAREKALLDAKEQVDKIAKINKLQVKKVVSIRENTPNNNQNDTQLSPSGASIYVDPITKKGPLTVSYEVKYELTPSFLPF